MEKLGWQNCQIAEHGLTWKQLFFEVSVAVRLLVLLAIFARHVLAGHVLLQLRRAFVQIPGHVSVSESHFESRSTQNLTPTSRSVEADSENCVAHHHTHVPFTPVMIYSLFPSTPARTSPLVPSLRQPEFDDLTLLHAFPLPFIFNGGKAHVSTKLETFDTQEETFEHLLDFLSSCQVCRKLACPWLRPCNQREYVHVSGETFSGHSVDYVARASARAYASGARA